MKKSELIATVREMCQNNIRWKRLPGNQAIYIDNKDVVYYGDVEMFAGFERIVNIILQEPLQKIFTEVFLLNIGFKKKEMLDKNSAPNQHKNGEKS